MRLKLTSTLSALTTVVTVLLASTPDVHADTGVAADITAYSVSWEQPVDPGYGLTTPLYAGMDMSEATCFLDVTPIGFGCGWELAFALRDGAFCAIGLVGAGKALTAWRLKKKLKKLKEHAEAGKANRKAIIYGIIGLLVGECLDFAASITGLWDCWTASLDLDDIDTPDGYRRESTLRTGVWA